MAIHITEPIETISIVSTSEHDVARINSLETNYKKERQESKAPTFALTRRSPYGEICRAITGKPIRVHGEHWLKTVALLKRRLNKLRHVTKLSMLTVLSGFRIN